MDCPKCGTKRAKTVVTVPADKREDGNVLRRRKCKACNQEFRTIEVLQTDWVVTQQQAVSSALPGLTAPLPSSPTAPLIDIEAELEDLLKPSLEALEEVLTSQEDIPKAKVDTARWLVADRREYRKALAGAQGEESSDPAIAELAQILSPVPNPEEAEA